MHTIVAGLFGCRDGGMENVLRLSPPLTRDRQGAAFHAIRKLISATITRKKVAEFRELSRFPLRTEHEAHLVTLDRLRQGGLMTRFRGLRIAAAAPFCLISLILLASCSRRPKDERVDVKTPELPPVATDEKSFASYQPAKPYVTLTPSVLARTVYSGDGPPGYRIEVRDWMVAAGKQSGSTTVPGAAFFEVRSGEGSLTVGGQIQQLQLGATFSVSQDQPFELTSSGSLPLRLRLYLVIAR